MDEENRWSDELQAITIRMWENRNIRPLRGERDGLAFKNLNGRYGYVEAADILNQRLIIRPHEKGDFPDEKYASIEEAIEAGWAVD